MERRRLQNEELKASRSKASEDQNTENNDTSLLDDLMEKLRNGDSVGRKARRNRPAPPAPLALSEDVTNGGDAVDLAKDMLAKLKSDGFEVAEPSPAIVPVSRSERMMSRRARLRASDALTYPISPQDTGQSDASRSGDGLSSPVERRRLSSVNGHSRHSSEPATPPSMIEDNTITRRTAGRDSQIVSPRLEAHSESEYEREESAS